MAEEYENTVFIFNISRHVWAYIIAGIFTSFTVLFSGYLIYTHFKWNQDMKLRVHVIRIILLLPIYALTAYLGQLNKQHMEYFTLVRDAYEAVVIYSFAQFLFDYLGGPKRLILLATYNVSPFPCSSGSEATEDDLFFSPEGNITNDDGEVIGKMQLVVEKLPEPEINELTLDTTTTNVDGVSNNSSNSSNSSNTVHVVSPTTFNDTHNDELDAYASKYKSSTKKSRGIMGGLRETLLGSPRNEEVVTPVSTDDHVVTLEYASLNAKRNDVNVTAHDRLALQQYVKQHADEMTVVGHAERRKHKHMAPANWCCRKPVTPARFVFLTKSGVLQYVPIEIFCSLLAFILYTAGVYEAGEWQPDNAYPYLSVVLNCSQMWAMYALVWFYHEYAAALAPCRPLWKFIAVKAVVFFTFWQSVMISIYSWIFPVPCRERGHHSTSVVVDFPTKDIDYVGHRMQSRGSNTITASMNYLPSLPNNAHSTSFVTLASTAQDSTPVCDKDTWSTSERAVALNNFLICIEMAVFAVLFSRVFSYSQFIYTDSGRREGREQYCPPTAVVDDRTMVKKIVTFFSPKDLLKDIGSQLHPRNLKRLLKDDEEHVSVHDRQELVSANSTPSEV